MKKGKSQRWQLLGIFNSVLQKAILQITAICLYTRQNQTQIVAMYTMCTHVLTATFGCVKSIKDT